MDKKADKLDMRIMAHLQKDANANNSQIAEVVGVSEETVRRRLRKLYKDDMVKMVAVPNAKELNRGSQVLVGIQTDVAMVDYVVRELKKRPDITRLVVTTGSFDMFASANLESTDDLSKFLREGINKIEGVRRLETFIVLSEEKEQYGVSMEAIRAATFPDAPAS